MSAEPAARPSYVPIIKWQKWEQRALSELRDPVIERVLPCLEIRDSSQHRTLLKVLGTVWPHRAMVDYANRLKAAADSVDEQFEELGQNIGLAIAHGLVTGIGTKGGSVLANVGKSIVAGIGGVFGQVGEALIEYGVIMTALLPALENIFTSGPAAIVAGVALAALGNAMQAAFSGTSSGSRAGANVPGGETINIALPGGIGQGGSPIPGAQPPAVPPGSPGVPILPTGSLGSALGSVVPQPNVALPAAGSLSTSTMPTIQIVTLGRWSPEMQRDAMREIRLAMRRGL